CNMDQNEYNRCIHDHDYLINKYFRNNKECMAFNSAECQGEIIRAHTISEMDLKNLSTDNHILVPSASSRNPQSLYVFEKKRINTATRITGFCKNHDNKLFESFEKSSFTASYSQIYDCAFRALCSQYFDLKCFMKFLGKWADGTLSSL